MIVGMLLGVVALKFGTGDFATSRMCFLYLLICYLMLFLEIEFLLFV